MSCFYYRQCCCYINILSCDSRCTFARFSLECVPEAGFLDCRECACSILRLSTLGFPQVGVSFPAPRCRVERPLFCIFSKTWFCWLFDFCQMTVHEVVSHWNFNLHLSDNRWASLNILGGIYISFSCEMAVCVSCRIFSIVCFISISVRWF